MTRRLVALVGAAVLAGLVVTGMVFGDTDDQSTVDPDAPVTSPALADAYVDEFMADYVTYLDEGYNGGGLRLEDLDEVVLWIDGDVDTDAVQMCMLHGMILANNAVDTDDGEFAMAYDVVAVDQNDAGWYVTVDQTVFVPGLGDIDTSRTVVVGSGGIATDSPLFTFDDCWSKGI